MGSRAVAGVQPVAVVELGDVAEKARAFVNQSRAGNTVKAYRSDWRHFATWCSSHNLVAMPGTGEAVALYIADLAESRKPSTISRRMAAISQAHQAAGYETPTKDAAVRAVWSGIRRAKGVAQQGKAPATMPVVKAMIEHLPANLLGARDRAMLLLGFAGAFRRSELVGLDVADVDITREGAVMTLRHSKTDQEGQGSKKGIPYGSNPDTCPVRALQGWLEASGITAGPLFRYINRHGQLGPDRLTDQAVALVVKRQAKAAGLDPAEYAGHSLRAGLATAAAMAGASERAIMNQTGHRSTAMLRRYIRDGSLFRENAAATVGL